MIAVETGWTFRDIDELTFPEYRETFGAHWDETPPVCVLVAALSGAYKNKPEKGKVEDLIDIFGITDLTKKPPGG